MIKKARDIDPQGDYRVIGGGDFSGLPSGHATSCSPSSPSTTSRRGSRKSGTSAGSGLLNDGGRIVNLVSSPDIYKHEWASFTTKDFPENRDAQTGDRVKIIMTDVEDRRPVEDVIWYDEDYARVFREAGLDVVKTYRPLAREDEPFRWVNETRIAPWVIYVLEKSGL